MRLEHPLLPEVASRPEAIEELSVLGTAESAAAEQAGLRIARLQDRTMALGPGIRAVVWFQGCSLRCRGCMAESMNRAPPRVITSASRLADWCISRPGIEGITLTGGDPFDQPLSSLAAFLHAVRDRSGLSIMLFTGRTLEQLRRSTDPAAESCLAAIDILVDGPYVEELNDGTGWRGSTNQIIHVLGDRARGVEALASAKRRLEILVSSEGLVSVTGIPRRGQGLALSRSIGNLSRKHGTAERNEP